MIDASTLLASPDSIYVRKRLIPVTVKFAREAGICKTKEGAVGYRLGDALLTGPAGEHWPVSRILFLDIYAPGEGTTAGCDGLYIKVRNLARAVRLAAAFSLPAGPLGDVVSARAGDWLLGYEDGSFGIVDKEIFAATYKPA